MNRVLRLLSEKSQQTLLDLSRPFSSNPSFSVIAHSHHHPHHHSH